MPDQYPVERLVEFEFGTDRLAGDAGAGKGDGEKGDLFFGSRQVTEI